MAIATRMTETLRRPSVHDQVRVEAEIDGKVVGFRAVVVHVLPDALWVGLVKPDSNLRQLRPGDPLVLTFSRGGMGMVAASYFLGHLRSTETRVFAVEMPADLRLIQRRNFLRLDSECALEYTVLNHSEAGGAGLTGEGVTWNISAGGLQFVVRAPIEETVSVGDDLEIRLEIGRGALLAEAQVVRVENATDMGPDGRPLPPVARPRSPRTAIAVRFDSISEGAQDRIIKHIFAIQRMRRANPGYRRPEAATPSKKPRRRRRYLDYATEERW
jgi:hypothetical protein